jgi:hypothetical protein
VGRSRANAQAERARVGSAACAADPPQTASAARRRTRREVECRVASWMAAELLACAAERPRAREAAAVLSAVIGGLRAPPCVTWNARSKYPERATGPRAALRKINANQADWRIALAAGPQQRDACCGACPFPSTSLSSAAAPPVDVPHEPRPGLARGRSAAARAREGDRRGERHHRAVQLPDPA